MAWRIKRYDTHKVNNKCLLLSLIASKYRRKCGPENWIHPAFSLSYSPTEGKALAACPPHVPPQPLGGGQLHHWLSLLSKNRFPSQMASFWILPEHLVPPTAHSREEGGVVLVEEQSAGFQQTWEECPLGSLLAEPPFPKRHCQRVLGTQ